MQMRTGRSPIFVPRDPNVAVYDDFVEFCSLMAQGSRGGFFVPHIIVLPKMFDELEALPRRVEKIGEGCLLVVGPWGKVKVYRGEEK